MKILVIGNDHNAVKDLRLCIQVRYPDALITHISKGINGVQKVETESPDIVIMDSSLPDMDHLDLIKQIRAFSDVPLIVLSHLETDLDRARDLEMGADDCISKSTNPIEILARIKALLRRARGNDILSDGIFPVNSSLSIDLSTHDVLFSGVRINLTPIEYKLFLELARSDGKILTHNAILDRVWGHRYIADASFIKKYIYTLRRKLESNGITNLLLTERGIGYRFSKNNHTVTEPASTTDALSV